MRTCVEIFRAPAFVWACVALAGGCFAAATAVCARKFLLGLLGQFIRLPPATKAVIVTAVVVATVFAQKPTNVATNLHESARIEEVMPAALNTENEEERRHGEGVGVLDRSDRIEGEGTGSSNPVNPVNPVKKSPCLPSSDPSALSAPRLAAPSGCFAGGYAGNPTLSSNDVVRGYRLETVRTNAAVSYARPANARLVGTWHLTDAYRGRAWVMLGEEGKGKREEGRSADGQRLPSSLFLFPLGRHAVTSLWAHTWGKVRPQLRNASNEIAVIGAPMFARHGQSFLWTAATTNGSVVLTWENFFLGNPYERSLSTDSHGLTRIAGEKPTALNDSNPLVAHPPVTAQLELFPNGDFIARSNEVERVYRRVNPDDWDDDGIPNDADDAPFAPADEPQFGPHQTLPEGANADAYCWVDLVVWQGNAKVTFAGDGESDLADPLFVAKVGETNRVTLLIGKTYRVTCPMPFELVGKSSDDIEESWEADGAALWLHWPVSIALKPAALAGGPAAPNTEDFEERRHGEGVGVSDRIDKIDRIDGDRAGSSNPVNPVNPVKKTPCLRFSNTSRALAGSSLRSLSRCDLPSETLCVSSAHVFSDSNTSPISISLLPTFQTFAKLPKLSKLPKPSKPFTMHVTPPGLGGAFTWTNVCCRVSGDGCTFSITCGDDCSCGGCSATGYLEYEGYRLPAYGGFCGCGGYVDHPGGETDPDERPPLPGASATFSKHVIFFEDEYENAPGKVVPWRSTETRLDCWAYGGTRGGHVRIEIADADGLVPYGGSPLPFEQDLEPGEEVTFKTTYRAVRPSGGQDDIVVTATFTENETGWTATTIDKATAIRLEFDAVAEAPMNKNPGRRKLGVRERLNCFQYPSSPSVEWVTSGGGAMVDGGRQFRSPLRAADNPLIARCQGVEYVPSLHVVEPEGIEVRNVTAVTYGVATNHAGGIGMRFELFLKPFDVSFSEIAVEEIPCERGERTGYFDRPEFVALQSHTTSNGAGRWMNVSEEDNGYGLDYAEIDSAIPRVKPSGEFTSELQYGWTDGSVLWPIPSGWGEKDRVKGDLPEAEIQESVTSLMTIQASGRSGVRKFRHQVTRDIDGTIFLDGVQVKGKQE